MWNRKAAEKICSDKKKRVIEVQKIIMTKKILQELHKMKITWAIGVTVYVEIIIHGYLCGICSAYHLFQDSVFLRDATLLW